MNLFQSAAEKLEKEYLVFLKYIDSNEVLLSKRTGHIGKKDCFAINQQFDIVKERYETGGRSQEYYTVIDFFYFFSVRSGILQIVRRKGLGFKRSERYHSFFEMSSIERYILMITVWLGEYQEALENHSVFNIHELYGLMKKEKQGIALTASLRWRVPSLLGARYSPEIRLFALFQLIRIEWLEETIYDKENKFRINNIYLTEEGDFWTKLFEREIGSGWFHLEFDFVFSVLKDIIDTPNHDMEEKLMHFWANPVEDGHHTIEFKIEVASCIRKIRMGDQFTLEDLHYLIQKSVDFDMDHLYYFQIGSGTSMRRYFAPECQDESWIADTVSLAELSLYEGMCFEYLFDFGDQWRFRISVEHILPEHMEECEIVEVKGEVPEQYAWD